MNIKKLKEIEALIDTGLSKHSIAEKLGTTSDQITKEIKLFIIENKNCFFKLKKWTSTSKILKNNVLKDIENGLGYSEIAKKHNIAPGTVWYIANPGHKSNKRVRYESKKTVPVKSKSKTCAECGKKYKGINHRFCPECFEKHNRISNYCDCDGDGIYIR